MGPGSKRKPHRTFAAAIVAVLMMFCALSLWTLIPLAWLWIGSQLADTQFPSVGPYAVTFFGAVLSILFVSWLLGLMNELFLKLTGSHTVEPLRPGWMRSMRDDAGLRQPPTLLEFVIIGSVVIAFLALVVWFFTLAGSPLDGG